MRKFLKRKFLLTIALVLLLYASLHIIRNSKDCNSGYDTRQDVNVKRNEFESTLDETNLTINDILITIKTTHRNEQTRVKDIIDTWYQFAKSQIYVVSDVPGLFKRDIIKNGILYTDCGTDHSRDALCCKFGHELSLFFSMNRTFKWLCHVDDDNYIHIPNLVSYLSKYDHNKNWYIGRASWTSKVYRSALFKKIPANAAFHFGTLGAGVCLSNSTMHTIVKHANSKDYMSGCQSVNLPDDMYFGYLLNWKLKINFTNEKKFNHHLDALQFSSVDDIHSRITYSFNSVGSMYDSTCKCHIPIYKHPKIATLFPNDTYKLRSLHCLLFPTVDFCRPMFIEAFKRLYTLDEQKSKKKNN